MAQDENLASTSWSFALSLSDTPPQPAKDLGCYCTASGPSVGHPIRIASGNMYEAITDYSTAGVNPLSFTRYYNSLATTNSLAGTLGRNWRSTYDRYLRITPGVIVAERADGQELIFTNNGGSWKSDSDVDLNLIPSGASWLLVNTEDGSETYDSGGKLTSIQARNGYAQTMSYNAGQLYQVADSFSRTLQFTYQSNRLASLTTPNGLVVSYGYNSSGANPGQLDRLASATYSTTPLSTRSYLYENSIVPFALTGIIDENTNRFATWTYDVYYRCLSSSLANGADNTSVSYNDFNGTRTVTDPLGLQTVYQFKLIKGVPKLAVMNRLGGPGVPPAQMTYTYDTNGYIATISDWNTNVTSLANDPRALPLRVTEAVGTPLTRVTARSFTTNFHLPLSVVASNLTTTFSYDASGNLLSRTETDTTTGNIPYPTAGMTRSWTNTFDNFGHLLSTVGPRTDVLATNSFTYDASNNVSTVTDALGFVTRYPSYTASGLPLLMIDPNGVTNQFSYDIRGRVLARITLAAAGNATNTFSYDSVGQLVGITLPNGSALNYQYDKAHRLQSVSNQLGESISYVRDAGGNITQQTAKGSSGNIVKSQQNVFDALGRLWMAMTASSQVTGFGYDANGNRNVTYYTTTVSNNASLLNYTVREFDSLNRMNASYDLLNYDNTIVQVGHDSRDNTTSITDPRALSTTYAFDGFGRVIQEISPDKGATIYYLDAAGNRTNEVDARGVVTLRSFDKLNRPTAVTFPASPGENMTFGYDSTNAGNFGIGRLTSYRDETGGTALKYNERGDVIAVSRTNSGVVFTTAYAFDLADNLTNVIYPSGHSVSYVRDVLGRVTEVAFHAGTTTTLASGVTYAPFGPVTGFQHGNGLNRTNIFDLDYRLVSLITRDGNKLIQSLGYAYSPDALNNLIAITDNVAPGNSQRFEYDQSFRLSQAAGNYGAESFTYDADGNRLTHTAGGMTETYAYATNANRLLSVSKGVATRSFTYTPNGNINGDNRGGGTNLALTYGNRNRYKQLSLGATTLANYAYNALGERLNKTVSGATTVFHYDLNHHLIAESLPNGTLIREYVWLGEMPVAQIEGNGSIYYIHADHLNRPQKMTDANQNIVWDSQPHPFGETGAGFYLSSGGYTNNQFRIEVGGSFTFSTTVQLTTNLAQPNWVSVMTNTGPFTFTDATATNVANRFYRVAYAPIATVVTNNLRFPGQYYDGESGFSYNVMRDYDSKIGRYIETDLVSARNYLAKSAPYYSAELYNAYDYVAANPLIATDPLGRTLVRSKSPFPGQDATQPFAPKWYVKNINDGSNKTKDLHTLTDQELYAKEVETFNRLRGLGGFSDVICWPWVEGSFDTPFWDGWDGPDSYEYYLYNGQIYSGHEINYFGIGMFEAAKGDSFQTAYDITVAWKLWNYGELPNGATIQWLMKGWGDYFGFLGGL